MKEAAGESLDGGFVTTTPYQARPRATTRNTAHHHDANCQSATGQ